MSARTANQQSALDRVLGDASTVAAQQRKGAVSTIDTAALTPATKRDLTALARTYEVKGKTHVSRLTYVNRLMSDAGLSVRGIEAATIAVIGHRPTGMSASTIGTYGLIRAQFLAREDVAANVGTGDALEAVVTAAYRLAGPTPKHLAGTSPATRVAALADDIAQGKGSAQAVEIAQAHVDTFNRADVAAALAPADRGPVTPDRKITLAADTDTDTPTTDTTPNVSRGDGEALASASVLALVSELSRRVASHGFTPDDVLTEAFDALAAAWEDAAALTTVDA